MDVELEEPSIDTEGIDEALEEELPPARAYPAGHRRQAPTPLVAAGPSPWERPREGFTATMTERVPEMRATKQASFVKGTSREA